MWTAVMFIDRINSSSFRESFTWPVSGRNELRRPIIIVTNQSGIGRGYFDESAYADLTRWMCDYFEAENAAISRVYHCPTTRCTASASTVAIIPGASPSRE